MPRIVILVRDGTVLEVIADEHVETLVVDFDTQGVDMVELLPMGQNGELAMVYPETTKVDKLSTQALWGKYLES